MENTYDSTISAHNVNDFIAHVISRFSQWSGVNVGYLFNMLVISENENEQLDALESCLKEFGKFEPEPEEYPWQNTPDDSSSSSPDVSITVECNMMLDELEKIRLRTKGEAYYE